MPLLPPLPAAVIGLTNRPELIDDALLRPGRLEVKLEVSLPDEAGRRDILRIHTRSMRANGALAEDAACFVDAALDACNLDASYVAATEGDKTLAQMCATVAAPTLNAHPWHPCLSLILYSIPCSSGQD